MSIHVTALGEVAMVAPPGGSATFPVDQVERVRRALAEARNEAVHNKRRPPSTEI